MPALTIKVISVVEGEEKKWYVEGDEPDETAFGSYSTREDALNAARQAARERGAELVVYKPDGLVDWTEEYEYGAHDFSQRSSPAAVGVPVVSVVEGEGNRWLIEGDGPDEVLGSFPTQSEAIEPARRYARERRAQLLVHSEDGTIDWAEDYSSSESEK